MRTTLPIAITFVLGLLFVAEFFIPLEAIHGTVSLLQEWGAVLAASAFILGGVNVIQVNIPKIVRREADWGYKVVLIVAAFTMIVAGAINRDEGGVYSYVYTYVYAPSSATMFALLSFFIASAAFRAFRARNAEATLMLIAAIIVMLGVIPLGEWIHPTFLPMLKDWILDYANNAGRRAILIGAALGAVATGLRVILGLERSHLGSD